VGGQKGKWHGISAELERWDDQPDEMRSKDASSLCGVSQGAKKIELRTLRELCRAYNLPTGSPPAAVSLKTDLRNMGLARRAKREPQVW
jgi:hypothetical protein